MSVSNGLIESDKKYYDTVNKIKDNYSLLQFLPSNAAIYSKDFGYTGKDPHSENPLIPMELLSNQLHTPESCKMSAAFRFSNLKYKKQKELDNGTITKTPGLKFTIVKDYSNGNPKYFLDPQKKIDNVKATGFATNFDNLSTATNKNGFINTLNPDAYGVGHNFSIEWYGVCIPDKIGNWIFEISSEDSCYVWIGDKAVHLYNYNNANLRISRPQSSKVTKQLEIKDFIKGRIYPIRIQYSNRNTRHTFNLSITPPDNLTQKNKYDILYSLSEEHPVMYYSLVKPNNVAIPNQYQCYVTNPTLSETNDKLRNVKLSKNMKKTIEIVDVWSLIPNINQLPSHGKTYLQFSIPLTVDNKPPPPPTQQQLNLYDGETKAIIQTVYDTNDSIQPRDPPQEPNKPYYFLYLDESGNNISLKVMQYGLGYGMSMVRELFKGTFEDAVSNPEWRNMVNEYNSPSGLAFMFQPPHPETKEKMRIFDKIEYVPPGSNKYTSLISLDKSKFKLHINSLGNLVLSYTRKKSILKAEDGYTVYTRDSNRFLYYLNTEEKMNKMFYMDDLSKNLSFIPYNSNRLQPNGQYIDMGTSVPGSGNGETVIDNSRNLLDYCKTQCNERAECHYFFKSNLNNQPQCILGTNNTENIFPSNYQGLNFNQADSRLYVKDKSIKKNSEIERVIPNKPIVAKNDYTKYVYYSNNHKMIDASARLGIYSNKEYKNWDINLQKKLLWGENASRVEPFDTQDCTLDPQGCIYNIEHKKIKPLIEISSEYSKSVNKIIQGNEIIENKIDQYKVLRTDLSNNPLYSYNDTKVDKQKTMLDGMNDDVNEMLLQENNMYIAGSMTVFTLVVVGIIMMA